MKIKVEFTIDVPTDSLPALRELGCCDTNAEAAGFVRLEARTLIHGYLEDHMHGVTVTEPWERRSARRT